MEMRVISNFMENLFPYILCVVQLGCIIHYIILKDWTRVLYWACATGIVFATTRMR
jgi:hypothetical protein